MRRGLGHLAAHMKDFIKNGSQIKILKIPQILMKISKYSILDHIDTYDVFQSLATFLIFQREKTFFFHEVCLIKE